MDNKKGFLSVFQVFQDKDNYFENLSKADFARQIILKQIMVIVVFAFVYGLVMGAYNSFAQALVSGIKLPLLFMLVWSPYCMPPFTLV